MRLQIASTVAAVIAQPKLSDELRDLLARHVRAQPDHRRAQVGTKRPCRRSRGNVGQSDLATPPATTPQPLMLGHPADDRGQLPDLMADRLTDLLADGQVATAAIAALGRMGQRRVGIADHLTMTTLMARLATGLGTRRLSPPTLGRLRRLRRIAGGRARAVRRVLPQPALQIIHTRRQRDQQLNDRIFPRSIHSPRILTSHARNIPCKEKESCSTLSDPLNGHIVVADEGHPVQMAERMGSITSTG